jgi:hypothetical protein
VPQWAQEIKGDGMQDFYDLLDRISGSLGRLEQRAVSSEDESSPIRYLPDPGRVPSKNEVAIGTGKFVTPSESPEAPESGICLNNKQATDPSSLSPQPPVSYSSVVKLVLGAPPALLEQWRSIAEKATEPEEFFARFTLVVEDASPDSCFGLLCFLARLHGIATDQVPADWANFIDDWERGDVTVSDNIFCAYGPLHNALVHGRLNPSGGGVNAREINAAWLDGLRLMIDAILSRRPPNCLPPWLNSPIVSRSRALLRFEQQAYEDVLRQATCVQLLIPLARTQNRYRLVDAFFTAPAHPLGSLKVFLRNDRERTYLKGGFSLMATNDHGTNETVVSVDPNVGIELAKLWYEFEQEEDRLWGIPRPNDKPRAGISFYPNQKRADGTPSPNEPWFIDAECTLVASPREVVIGANRLSGSKLDFAGIKEVIWRCYQPFRHVRVTCGLAPRSNENERPLVPLEGCYRITLAEDVGDPRLFIAGWHPSNNSDQPFKLTPTLCKYLAACIIRWRPATAAGPVRLSELPHESTYDVLESTNAVIVVSAHGAFVLYDELSARPPLLELKNEFERAVTIRRRIERGGERFGRLLDDIKAYSAGRRSDLIESDLAEQLMIENIEIALELHKADSAIISHEARQFRHAVMASWGIETWLGNLARDIELVKGVLQARAGFAVARRLEFLQRFGVPVALAVVFYGVCAATEELWSWSISPVSLSRLAIGLIMLAALSAFNYFVLEAISRNRKRAQQLSLGNSKNDRSAP